MKRSFSAENIVSIRSLNILLIILSLFSPRGAMSGSESESLALEIGGATDINDKGSHSESPVDPDDDVPLAEIKKRIAELEKVKQARSRKYLEDKLARLEREDGIVYAREDEKHVESATTVKDLRQNKSLRRQVKGRLAKLGIESSDSSSEDTVLSDAASGEARSKKKRATKSGIQSAISENCIYTQRWAHCFLQYPYASTTTQFNEIGFSLFVAGELEIISSKYINKEERLGRIELLKLLAYKCEKCEWPVVRKAYASWLQQIEIGNKSWTDDPSPVISLVIEDHILSKHALKNRDAYKERTPKTQRDEKVAVNSATSQPVSNEIWFCTNFNRNKCKKDSPHNATINGRSGIVSHICATCWRSEKVQLSHPECSSACPHADE